MRDWILHLLSFGIVGTIGLLIDFGITWVLKEKCNMNEYTANAIGFAAAVANNFILNKYFTFHDDSRLSMVQFAKFASVSVIGLGLNSLFLFLLCRMGRLRFYWSKLWAIGAVFIWNFIINSFFTF